MLDCALESDGEGILKSRNCDDERHCVTSGVCLIVSTELNLGAESRVISVRVAVRSNIFSNICGSVHHAL